VSGEMMRLAPSGEVLGRIARLLEEGTIRPDVATVYALQDAARPGKTSPGTCPGFMDVAQWAGSGKTQVTRQDRASCGLDTSTSDVLLGLRLFN